MNRRLATFIAVMSLVFLLGGCATSRSVLDVPSPVMSGSSVSPSAKTVLIASVKDQRQFEVSPSSPNIPSLDPSESQSDSVKKQAIGRKRNGFGKALGDILLKDGQSVETLTADAIRQAFAEKGFRVISRPDQGDANTLVVNAVIDKFWSWMNPGFWAITLSTEISTTLQMKSPDMSRTETVSVTAADYFQTGMEDNWTEVIKQALRLYIDDLKGRVK